MSLICFENDSLYYEGTASAVGLVLKGEQANKTVNDLRNDGYHSYSAEINDNGRAKRVHCHLTIAIVI